MSLVEQIRKPILSDLKVFNKIFADSLTSDNPLLSSVNDYVLSASGKNLRPIIVILSAKLCGEISDATYYSALSVELLHNASLIHDDVVDDTMERRGRSSINARWTNKIAVLSGDYMLSNSLLCATKTENLKILEAIAEIGMELSDGELVQLINTQQTKITEEDYFKVTRKKTAFLFATCAEVGALSVNANAINAEHLHKFGEYLGMCFQIKDDIFDYFTDIEIGKPTANDIRDGKVTLPLIYALKNSENQEKLKIMSIIDSKDFTKDNVDTIIKFAHANGGVDYASQCMLNFKNKAIEELKGFEDCEIKRTLILCAEYAAQRSI